MKTVAYKRKLTLTWDIFPDLIYGQGSFGELYVRLHNYYGDCYGNPEFGRVLFRGPTNDIISMEAYIGATWNSTLKYYDEYGRPLWENVTVSIIER